MRRIVNCHVFGCLNNNHTSVTPHYFSSSHAPPRNFVFFLGLGLTVEVSTTSAEDEMPWRAARQLSDIILIVVVYLVLGLVEFVLKFYSLFAEEGHGMFNHVALLTCGLILLYVTTECLGVGYVLNRAECDLDITVTERGLIAASTLIGVVTPAIFWGYMGDEYGRRKVMLPTLLATVVVSICSSMAVSFWNMFLLRLLVGLIISAICATVYVYLGELHTAKHRAPAIAWGSSFIALSYFTMPAFGWAILPRKWSVHIMGSLSLVSWRVFMWTWCFWGILAAIGLYILPESPRYLLATAGPEAVVPVLAKMYAWNHKMHVDDYPVTEIISRVHEIPRLTFMESFKRMGYMIRPPLRRCVLISHTCNFLVFMQSNAFYVWMPHIVNELLHSPTALTSMCSLMNSKYSNGHHHESDECRAETINNLMYPISMVTGVLTAIMYVTIGLVVEKYGKKLVFCTIMMTCSLLILGAGVLPHAYISIAFLIPGMCGITANTVLATVAVEVFPTSLRALALCTLFMIGRLGAAVGAHMVGLGLQHNCTMVVLAMTLATGGHGTFNYLALLTCGFILLYVTTECLGAGYMLNGAECDLDISVTERGFVAAATFIGVVSTAIFWGYLGDTYGRRRVMLPALLGTISMSFCSSLSVNFWNMFILRLLTGCLVSASIATVYAYLGELHTASHRASAVAYGSAFIACSLITMPGMAWLILPRSWHLHVSGRLSIVPWRVFMWAWCCWGGLAALGLAILPESPRYLLATKGPNAVLPVLAKMYAWNHKKKMADYPVTEISAAQQTRPSFKESIQKLKYMLKPPLLRCVLISHTCIFLLFMQTNAFYVWMPHIVNELLSSNVSTSMCHIMDAKYAKNPDQHTATSKCKDAVIDSRMYPISMIMGILTAIIYVSIGFVIDRWGRKRVYCSLVMFCSVLTMFSGMVPHAYLAIAMFIPGLCGGAATSVLATLAVEVFPTSLRAMALCVLFMVARLGAAVGSNLLGIGLQTNCVLVTVSFTLLTAGSTLSILLWPDSAKVRAEMEAKDFTY